MIADAPEAASEGRSAPLVPYQRRLLVLLCLTVFFDAYDFFSLSQTLPNLRAAFKLSVGEGGDLVSLAGCGTLAGYFLLRLADRWGRRKVLLLSIAGYMLSAVASGLAPTARWLLLMQLLARIFLVSGLGLSFVIAAEEYPADRRGRVAGLLQACASLGAITCAVLTPRLLLTAAGWRAPYLAGGAAVLLFLGALFGLRETARFSDLPPERRRVGPLFSSSLFRPPYRRRVLQLGVLWTLVYACGQTTLTFFKEHALADLGLKDAGVGRYVAIGALVAMPLTLLCGRLLDRAGRRPGAVLILCASALGILGCYLLRPGALLLIAIVLMISSSNATLLLLNTLTAELFPTELRGDGLGATNSLLGRVGFIAAPLLIAHLAERVGWTRAVAPIALLPLCALLLILTFLPETAGRSLEETASGGSPRRAEE